MTAAEALIARIATLDESAFAALDPATDLEIIVAAAPVRREAENG